MENLTQPRRRWFRFSLRTMLMLVTLVCILLAFWLGTENWLERRRQRYGRLAFEHQIEMSTHWTLEFRSGTPKSEIPKWLDYRDAYHVYHEKLYQKYKHAYEHPWVSVEPDPPAPAKPEPHP